MNIERLLNDLPDMPEIRVVAAPRFPLGRIVATARALRELLPGEIMCALARHAKGDWGDVSEDDEIRNNLAVRDGSRIISAYRNELGKRFWVITECGRSVTSVIFPDED